jgi:ornithine cyclodeaminase
VIFAWFTEHEHEQEHEQDHLGIKVVSVRANNPSKFGLPLVPVTILSIQPETGVVQGIVAVTHLTAARTATGSVLSTIICCPYLKRLCVFGAGLQAKMHIYTLATALRRPIPHITIIN